MADDSFIQEVNEEIRQERARALWGRYGPIGIGIAVALVAFTAIYQIYNSWYNAQISKAGDMMLNVLALEKSGQTDKALEVLKSLQEKDIGVYGAMAKIHEALIQDKEGKHKEAVALLERVANESGLAPAISYIARIRAAYILMNYASVEEIRNCLAPLFGGSMQAAAYEALGYAQWQAGQEGAAKESFQKVVEYGVDIRVIAQARAMIDLINGNEGKVKTIPTDKQSNVTSSATKQQGAIVEK